MELERVLTFLQDKYNLLSEAEIIKMVLSERYYKEVQQTMEWERQFRKFYSGLKKESRELGDKFLSKKGLKRESVSEEEFYRLLDNA